MPAIPGYAIDRLLGEGAYGRVFLARETEGLKRPVALKVFSREHREKFERELEMAGKVEEIRRLERTTALVQALGSGESGGLSYLALEYLEDGSLQDLVAKGPLPADRAIALTREAAAGLILLHRAGIFHRDVKPANLLLGSDGHVRVGDFGLSRSLDGSLSAAGSPAFAAPEVIAGRVTDGRLADVYSLGATLAFLLTGETMLPGRPDVFALERRAVPRPVQATIVAACSLDPAERLGSIEALLASLDARIEEKARVNPPARDDSREGSPEDMLMVVPVRPARTSRAAIASLTSALLVLPSLALAAILFLTPRVMKAGEEAPGTNPVVLAIAVIAVCLPFVLEVLAFVLGFHARARINASDGQLLGRGLATAGIVIAVLNVVGPVVFSIVLA